MTNRTRGRHAKRRTLVWDEFDDASDAPAQQAETKDYPWLKPGYKGPTPPLDEYLAAEVEDSNVFWMIPCGHHQNLLDSAVEQRDNYREALDSANAEIERLQHELTRSKASAEAEQLRRQIEKFRYKVKWDIDMDNGTRRRVLAALDGETADD